MTCRIRAGEVARPLTRLHPKGCSARSWRDRSGDPSCLGPPLLPMHSCRPVIRAAAGLGVHPDRPAAVAGSCRQEGILAHVSRKIPMESGLCGVTHRWAIRVDTRTLGTMWRVSRTLGPALKRLIPATDYTRCATRAGPGGGCRTTPNGGCRPVTSRPAPDGPSPGHKAPAETGPTGRVRQLAGSRGTVTRAVRRSPSRTRSARASVSACTSASPR